MKRLKLAASALLWSALLTSFIAPARAEDFPSRPIHLILPFQPGGIVDFAGRVLGQKLSDALGQTVVPDNKPGAGGIVGLDYVAHSPPDGYNIVLIDPSVVINPQVRPRSQGEPRPVSDPSSDKASAKPMLMPAPIEAASPTRKVCQL